MIVAKRRRCQLIVDRQHVERWNVKRLQGTFIGGVDEWNAEMGTWP
jgi:hypothetical protein